MKVQIDSLLCPNADLEFFASDPYCQSNLTIQYVSIVEEKMIDLFNEYKKVSLPMFITRVYVFIHIISKVYITACLFKIIMHLDYSWHYVI